MKTSFRTVATEIAQVFVKDEEILGRGDDAAMYHWDDEKQDWWRRNVEDIGGRIRDKASGKYPRLCGRGSSSESWLTPLRTWPQMFG
jgi:hypothetical protein